MAITITPLTLASAQKIISDSDVDATAERNMNNGAAVVYGMVLDNSANAAATYYKFYAADNPTVGTTTPDFIFMVGAVSRTVVSKRGLDFGTALSLAGVTAGGTAGTTSPTSNAAIDIVVG